VPGHAGVEGNELADQEAKEGGLRDQEEADIDTSSAFQQLRRFTLQEWQKEFENTAQSKPTGTANWYLKCCRGQPSSRIPPGVSRQAQRAIHQLRLNRLSSTASYQALIGQIESPTCSPSAVCIGLVYATADEAVSYMFYRFFLFFSFPKKYQTTVLGNG